jgi:type IV secretion system protein VirD4
MRLFVVAVFGLIATIIFVMQFNQKLYRARFMTYSEKRTILKRPLNKSIWQVIEAWILKLIGFQPSAKTGFCYGDESLSVEDSFTHSMTIAATGSGKTQTCVLPSLLLNPDASFVVTDPSGELLEKTSGYLEQQNYKILTLDFRPGATNSHSHNILAGELTLSRLKEIAELLYEVSQSGANGRSENGQFWRVQCISILFVLLWLLSLQPKKYRNLSNLRSLLQRFAQNPRDIQLMILKTQNKELFDEFKAILSGEKKVIMNAISTAMTVLDKWSDPIIAALTTKSNLDLNLLRECKTALFIIVPEEQVRYYKPVIALLFQDIFRMAMKPKVEGKPYRSILMLIEEAANVGILSGNFPEIIATIRKRNVGISLIFQSVSQIINAVGRENAETIIANCLTKCYLSGMDYSTAETLVRQLGKTVVQYTDLKDQIREGVREMMTIDEVLTLPKNMAIFYHKNNRPAILKLKPAYRHNKMRKRMRIKPKYSLPRIAGKIAQLPIPKAPPSPS